MTFLAAALPYISAAGTIISTIGSIQEGRAADANARFQAAQMEQQAGQERASAQREAIAKRREAKLAASRVMALAGGGAGDAGIINILGDIEAQGEYNAQSALYSGEERALGYEVGATSRRMEGKAAKTGSLMKAGNTLLSGFSGNSLLNKYSPTGEAFGQSPNRYNTPKSSLSMGYR